MPTAHALEGARRSGGSGDLRHGNLTHILRYVRDHGPCSRHDIAHGCGLGVSTLTDLINELRNRRLVRELDPVRRPAAGRPTRPIMLDGEPWCVMGVHVDIDTIEIAVATVGGEELWQETVPVELRGVDADEGFRLISETVTRHVGRLEKSRELVSVEVGLAGYVSRDRGSVCSSRTFGWEDVPLRAQLERTLWDAGITAPVHVGMANDCQLAALVRRTSRAAAAAGPGGGLPRRNPEPGQRNPRSTARSSVAPRAAPATSGTPTWLSEGEQCWCGRTGCLQTAVSPVALLTRGALLPRAGAEQMVERASDRGAVADLRGRRRRRPAGAERPDRRRRDPGHGAGRHRSAASIRTRRSSVAISVCSRRTSCRASRASWPAESPISPSPTPGSWPWRSSLPGSSGVRCWPPAMPYSPSRCG